LISETALTGTAGAQDSASWLARAASVLVGYATVVYVYGAIPFLSIPALGQVLWVSGFAKSFANGPIGTIHAHDFGLPAPAPIVFGLSGALVESLILRWTSLELIDAYALMIMLYLALAFAGAIVLARRLGASRLLAVLMATLWNCLPLVWFHSSYSMLSIGFALLPGYLLVGMALIDASHTAAWPQIARCAAWMAAASILAVFTDGYTFVMFATACGLYWLRMVPLAWRQSRGRIVAAAVALGACFTVATGLYLLYVGHSGFDGAAVGVFRAFGASLIMLLVPTQHMIWLWDVLHLSQLREPVNYFGDASVWATSYIAPLLLTGVLGFALARAPRKVFFALLALVGIYLALGPSLKWDPRRAANGDPNDFPVSQMIVATGQAWATQHVPGIKNMRAAYRWIGLADLGLWCLTVLLLADRRRRLGLAWTAAIVLIATTGITHVRARMKVNEEYRSQFFALRRDLADPLAEALRGSTRVAFAPHGNDFMANYLAAYGVYDTLNIGGDKNVALASRGWSPMFRALQEGTSGQLLAQGVRQIIVSGEVDRVVVPYVDMLWDAHAWPPPAAQVSARRERTASALDCVARDRAFTVSRHDLFAVVELSSSGKKSHSAGDDTAFAQGRIDCPYLAGISWPGDEPERFKNVVGELVPGAGTLKTDGRNGFILYGPYSALAPGRYSLVLSGNIAAGSGGYVVDVTAGSDDHVLVSVENPQPPANGAGGILLSRDFDVPEFATNVQLRIRVQAETQMQVTSLTVTPVVH